MRPSGIEGCGLAPGEGVSRSPRLLRERALHAAGNEVAAAVTLSHPANKKRRRYQRRSWCTYAWTGPLRLALTGATRSGTAGVGTPARDPLIRIFRARRGVLIYRNHDPRADY